MFHTHRGVPVVSFFTKPGFDRARPEIAAFQLQMVDNDTELLYESLHATDGISIPHTIGTFAGVDWRYADPLVEPVVELYQGARCRTSIQVRHGHYAASRISGIIVNRGLCGTPSEKATGWG